MKLSRLSLLLVSSMFAIGVVAACSDSGSGGGANTDGGGAGADASTSSSQDDGGKKIGSGNEDSGASVTGKDAGSPTTDSGAVTGSCKKINDGMYTVMQTAVPGNDVDAGATYQFLCSSNTSTDTYPDSNMDTSGCTITPSSDGCTSTYDCTMDKNGYTATTKGTETIASDGNGFTTNFVVRWTSDTTGDVVLDCTFTRVGTRK